MRNSKIKLSILFTLVFCMVVSVAMPIMTSAEEDTTARVLADLQGIRDYTDGLGVDRINLGSNIELSAANKAANGKGLCAALDIIIANYKADPSDENLRDTAAVLNAWIAGGHDAGSVFLTDKLFGYFYDFAKVIEEQGIKESGSDDLAFTWPMQLKDKKDENSGYLYAFAKRFVTNTDTYKEFYANSKIGEEKGINGLFEHFMAVDSSLYVSGRDAKAVAAKAEETKSAMNAAATAKDAAAIFQSFIEYINADGHMVLKSASEMYKTLAKINYILKNITDGDADALATLEETKALVEEYLNEVDEFGMAAYPIAGIVQYRPAGQADSFTDDSVAYSESFKGLNDEVVEVIDEYAKTVDNYDARIAGFTYNDPYAPINNGGNGGNGGNNGGNNNGGSDIKKPDNTADALTALFAVTAIVSAGCAVALVKAKKNYNR